VDASGHNNGNVANIVNNIDHTRSQYFAYDALNRIATAQTETTGVTIPNANCWGLTYAYDPWGNQLSSSTTGPAGCSEPMPTNFTVNTSNRIATNFVLNQTTNYCYDAAGNLIFITAPSTACPNTGPYQYTFNAENQLTSTAGVTYTYDGDGKRVMKSNGTIYWYGAGSDPLMETDLSNNMQYGYIFFNGRRTARVAPNNDLNWYFADHLGTARVLWSLAGKDESDFYPFGGERIISSNKPNHHFKFTGKERDSESGNDYFGARYYTSNMGRWLSPDRLNVTDDRVTNPSNTLNKYVYGANNPFRFVDPDGRDIVALYEPPHGVLAGHFMLFANNSATGQSAMMSFGPVDNSAGGRAITVAGGPMASTQTFAWPQSADELRQNFASLTIQTTPEQAQEVISFIQKFSTTDNPYELYKTNCTTICRDALKAIGLIPKDNSSFTPAGFWDNVFSRYAKPNAFNDWLVSNGYTPHGRGKDYGNPRFGMNTFDFIMLSLRQKTCVTTLGPDGHGGSMPIKNRPLQEFSTARYFG